MEGFSCYKREEKHMKKKFISSIFVFLVGISSVGSSFALSLNASEIDPTSIESQGGDGYVISSISPEEIDAVTNSEKEAIDWISSQKSYSKGDIIVRNGEKKIAINNFTTQGDDNWWYAPSLLVNVFDEKEMANISETKLETAIEKLGYVLKYNDYDLPYFDDGNISTIESDFFSIYGNDVYYVSQSGAIPLVKNEYTVNKEAIQSSNRGYWQYVNTVYKKTSVYAKVMSTVVAGGAITIYLTTTSLPGWVAATWGVASGAYAQHGSMRWVDTWGTKAQYIYKPNTSSCLYKNVYTNYKYSNYTGYINQVERQDNGC
jgi:hypothetical protein